MGRGGEGKVGILCHGAQWEGVSDEGSRELGKAKNTGCGAGRSRLWDPDDLQSLGPSRSPYVNPLVIDNTILDTCLRMALTIG